jgi:two-component sensor histidine kinase
MLLGVVVIITVLSILFLRSSNKKIKKRDREKLLLLQEIHHRVKNNFQIVSSLLQLQTKGIKDAKALELAIEGQNRVKSMALIHEKLYQNENLIIECEDYITSLVEDISKVYQSTLVENEIRIPSNFNIDIDTAIPLGLILNELITNAFKYAFSNSNSNKLVITCIQNKVYNVLSVSDNGEGIVDGMYLKKSDNIGLKLVRSLAKQLHGYLEYEFNEGATFKVYFKETSLRNEEE